MILGPHFAIQTDKRGFLYIKRPSQLSFSLWDADMDWQPSIFNKIKTDLPGLVRTKAREYAFVAVWSP